jgi:hypothetical protein
MSIVSNRVNYDETAYPLATPGGGGSSPIGYTYIVDSQAAFDDWVNNVAGNDYTSVFIMPGHYTLSKTLNLNTTSTYYVEGTILSSINIDAMSVSTAISGISYSYGDIKQYIRNLSFKISNNNANLQNLIYSVSNLYNINVNVDQTQATNSLRPFWSCKILNNCSVTGTTKGNMAGYYECEHLSMCTFSCAADSASDNISVIGYYGCNRVVDCIINCTSNSNNIYFGINNCSYVVDCYIRIVNNSASANNIMGVYNSNNVISTYVYTIKDNASNIVYAFNMCNRVVSCTATVNNASSTGICYRACTGLLMNKTENSDDIAYSSCQVEQGTVSSPTAPANTAAGGWNA